MFNRNLRIPRWLGPVIGALVGAYFAGSSTGRDGRVISIEILILGALLGAAAGTILWLVDRKGESEHPEPAEKGTPLSRAIAVIQILVFWLPILGACFSLFGLVCNWNVIGWPKTLCWVGTVLSLLICIPFIFLLIYPPGIE